MDAIRVIRRLGALVLSLALVGPAGASAAPSTVGYNGTTHVISYTDPSGNTDHVRVEVDEDSSQENWFGFHDFAGDPFEHDGTGCTTHNAVLICPPDGERFVFQLAGGDDVLDLSSVELVGDFALPSEVHGGPGSDQFRDGLRGDEFSGDAGDDTVFGLGGSDRYLGGDGDDTLDLTVGGPWTVSLDGVINDGPVGSPQANVGVDVERIFGGPLGDTLTGGAGAQLINGGDGADVIDGGPAQDALQGGPGDDSVAARDGGPDTIDCGAGTDSVTADWNDIHLGGCESISRSVRDDDGDGAAHDADCNDANPAIKPGGGDIPGNGVDEDCDGHDAVLDRDGDGARDDADCDDANAAIKPGAVDVPGNRIDEDCSGADARRAQVAGTFASGWSVFRRWTVITKLTLKGAPAGAALQVRCAGKGCPLKRKTVRLKSGGAKLTKLFKGAKLRPGAVVDLRLTAPGAIGKVLRLTVRKAKAPKRSSLCLPPGGRKPGRC